MDLAAFSTEDLKKLEVELKLRYDEFKARDLELDMTRGKPSSEQLDLALGLLSCTGENDYKTEDGVDCRNYGGLDGIPETKRLFSEYMGVRPEELIIGGNSSLKMMHDTFITAMIHGTGDDAVPWGALPKVRFLCPSPGYDRHFSVCEYLGIEMIPIDMNSDGPDMDMIEKLTSEDDAVKGIWCVPKYSNPTGTVYSDEIVDSLAGMETKAQDFRIFWDNAYAVHQFTGTPVLLKNMLTACKNSGNPERVYMFGSTSKISFGGAGIAMMAGSEKNMNYIRKQMSFQTIGPDKLNQLRHARFFENVAAIEDHMKKHAEILKPKFGEVLFVLDKEIGEMNIASWTRPDGGYFVSLDTMDDCADSIVKMAAEAGVKLTPAGSTYPYMKDPMNRNIRLAPSFPPVEDVKLAMELLVICIQLVSIDKILNK